MLFILFFTVSNLLSAQTGSVSGMITDKLENDTLPFVNVVILNKNHDTIAQTTNGFDGRYEFSNLPPGKYKLKATYLGGIFKPYKKKLIVLPDSNQIIDIQLEMNKYEPTVIINASKPKVSICFNPKSIEIHYFHPSSSVFNTSDGET